MFRGLGFRVYGLGFRGLGFRGLGFRGLGFRVLCHFSDCLDNSLFVWLQRVYNLSSELLGTNRELCLDAMAVSRERKTKGKLPLFGGECTGATTTGMPCSIFANNKKVRLAQRQNF